MTSHLMNLTTSQSADDHQLADNLHKIQLLVIKNQVLHEIYQILGNMN